MRENKLSQTDDRFDAFISYRRSDGTRMARALRKRLQTYNISKRLPDHTGQKLKIFLDTIYERGAVDFYEKNIFPALTRSKFLIVLATPDAVLRTKGEDWILREIMDFRTHCQPDNILVVRTLGEFDDVLPGDLDKTLPNVQKIDLRGEGSLASLSPLRATRLADEWLKLVAPLFAVQENQMPILRREQERAQQTRIGIAFGGILGALTFSIGVAALAISANLKADAAISESLFAIGQLMRTTADLPDGKKTGSTKATMIARSCDLFDSLSNGAIPNGYVYERALCDTDRARAYMRSGDKTRSKQLIVKLRNDVEAQLSSTKSTDSVQAMRQVLDYEWDLVVAQKTRNGDQNAYKKLRKNLDEAIALGEENFSDLSGWVFVERRIWALIEKLEKAKQFGLSRELMHLALARSSVIHAQISSDLTIPAEKKEELSLNRVIFSRRLAWLDAAHLNNLPRAEDRAKKALKLLEVHAKHFVPEEKNERALKYHWQKVLAFDTLGVALMKQKKFSQSMAAFGQAVRTIKTFAKWNLSDEFKQKVIDEVKFIKESRAKLKKLEAESLKETAPTSIDKRPE